MTGISVKREKGEMVSSEDTAGSDEVKRMNKGEREEIVNWM